MSVSVALVLAVSGAVQRGDTAVHDSLLRTLSTDADPAEPIIIAIDARSIDTLGRWPWPREVHAALITRLTEADVRAVGIDVLFSEPSADPEVDAYLARTIAENGRVVLPLVSESGRLGGPLRETLPIPVLADAAAALGHVDMEVDGDGVVRTTFLRAGLGAPEWPAFGLALARLAAGSPVSTAPAGRPGAPRRVPTTWVREDPVLIPFLGPPGRVPRLSYSDVLQGHVPAAMLRNRVVLIGATAAGVGDVLPTPLSGHSLPMSGVEVNASVYRGVVDGTLRRPISGVFGVLLTLATVLLPLLLYPHTGWKRCAVIAGVALVLPLAVSAGVLLLLGFWWAPMGAFAGSLLGFVLWSWRRSDSTRAALSEGRRQAAATLRSIGEGVVTADAHARITYMNPVAEALIGRDLESVVGEPIGDVLQLADLSSGEPATQLVRDAMGSRGPVAVDGSLELFGAGGRRHGVDLTVSRVSEGNGQNYGWVFALRDVTESRALAERVAYQASHDALTDLPNRALLRDRLDTGLARARRAGRRLAVVFIDLDRFKSVNDSFGHEFGDRLLVAMASRLSEAARDHDTVARIGGDEFVVVIEDTTDALDISVLTRRLHETLARPINVDGQDLLITASCGVSVYPRDAQDPEDLMRNADAAMYRAKESGRNTVRFYSEDLNRRARRRAALERALRRALDNGKQGLAVYYQPIVCLASGRVIGTEALVRWHDPEFGQVDPEEFISVAEETGLISALGQWVMNTACEQAREWRDGGFESLRMSVNLSPRQLAYQDVPEMIAAALRSSGIDPQLLEVEITETEMVQDMARNAEVLDAVKALGVSVAVDDFGTGYSSLSFLKRFPVDRVKIDRSFVHDIGSNRESTAIVKAVLVMAHSMSLIVVAEGIETRSQAQFMEERGCDEGQGFFLARPASAADITQRLYAAGDLRVGTPAGE